MTAQHERPLLAFVAVTIVGAVMVMRGATGSAPDSVVAVSEPRARAEEGPVVTVPTVLRPTTLTRAGASAGRHQRPGSAGGSGVRQVAGDEIGPRTPGRPGTAAETDQAQPGAGDEPEDSGSSTTDDGESQAAPPAPSAPPEGDTGATTPPTPEEVIETIVDPGVLDGGDLGVPGAEDSEASADPVN